MKKKHFCLLLAVLLLMVLLPLNAAAAEDASGGSLSQTVTWEFKDGTLIISGEGEMEGMSSSRYPPWYYLHNEIKTVIIGEGITTVGPLAFADCVNLTRVQLPSTVRALTARCFYNCQSLTQIELPLQLTFLGSSAFEQCSSLKSMILPNALKDTEGYTFKGCTSLESVTLSNKLERVSFGMFDGCKCLKEITLPKSVTRINDTAFRFCESLTKVEIQGKIKFVGDFGFAECRSLATLDFPAGLQSIGSYAFQGCRSLMEIWFRGDLPDMSGYDVFDLDRPTEEKCTIYYPANNKTWTKEMVEKYAGYYHLRLEPFGTPECDHKEVTVPGKEATCTEEGLTEGKYCSVCGKVLKKQKTIDTLGHDLVTTTVPPTCTEPGYDSHRCSRCEYSETDNPMEATGHSFGEWETVKKPTITEKGLSRRVCTACGETQQQELEKLTPLPTEPPAEPIPTAPVQTESSATAPNETEPAPVPPAPQERAAAGLWIVLILLAVVGAIAAVKILTKKKS